MRSCSRALVTRGVTSDLRFDRLSALAEEILPLSRVEHLLRWSVNGSMQCEVLAAFDRLNSTKPLQHATYTPMHRTQKLYRGMRQGSL